jgi:hypothetical protein
MPITARTRGSRWSGQQVGWVIWHGLPAIGAALPPAAASAVSVPREWLMTPPLTRVGAIAEPASDGVQHRRDVAVAVGHVDRDVES